MTLTAEQSVWLHDFERAYDRANPHRPFPYMMGEVTYSVDGAILAALIDAARGQETAVLGEKAERAIRDLLWPLPPETVGKELTPGDLLLREQARFRELQRLKLEARMYDRGLRVVGANEDSVPDARSPAERER